MIIFETERLIVRTFSFSDSEFFFQLNSSEEIMRYIREPFKTQADTDVFLKEIISAYSPETALGRWAVEEKSNPGFVIGSFAIIPIKDDPRTQLGYALFEDARGKGYAGELVRGSLPYIKERLQLETIYAITEKQNLPSQKVLL